MFKGGRKNAICVHKISFTSSQVKIRSMKQRQLTMFRYTVQEISIRVYLHMSGTIVCILPSGRTHGRDVRQMPRSRVMRIHLDGVRP